MYQNGHFDSTLVWKYYLLRMQKHEAISIDDTLMGFCVYILGYIFCLILLFVMWLNTLSQVKPVKWLFPKENAFCSANIFRHLQEIFNIVYTILCDQVSLFHLSIAIIVKVMLLSYVIYCSARCAPAGELMKYPNKLNLPAMVLYSVKCYRGGRKMDLISPISKIQTQMWYHCIQYSRRHLMSLISRS